MVFEVWDRIRSPSCATARPSRRDTWYADEVFLRINGALVYLWRAVDQDGEVLDVLVVEQAKSLTIVWVIV